MNEWKEDVLVRYPFRYGDKDYAGEARLGFPRPDLAYPDEWVCSFQVQGVGDDKIHLARGEDGLQAIVIASEAVRKSLDRLKNVNSEMEPYEFVFPRYLPFCLGLEFHRRLCKLIDVEVKTEQQKLAGRRRSRKS